MRWRASRMPRTTAAISPPAPPASVAPLNERDRWLCQQIGPALRAAGMLFVGLDVIGGYVTEINVTSPTGVRELDQPVRSRYRRPADERHRAASVESRTLSAPAGGYTRRRDRGN